MKIRYIRIGSFGTLHNYEIDNIYPGLNVVFGENESGKTTLMEFIRSTLFPSRKKTYPAPSKNDNGTLTVAMDDGSVVSVKRGSGQIFDQISQDTYRSVYAMTPKDLRDLEIISSGDIKTRFLTVPGGKNLPDTVASIEKEMSDLMSPDRRSENRKIGKALSDLDKLEREISVLSGRNDEYDALFAERVGLEGELSVLRKQEADIETAIMKRNIQASQEKNVRDLALINERISGLSDSDIVKEGDKEEFYNLKNKVGNAERKLSDAKNNMDGASTPLKGYDPEKVLRNEAGILELSKSSYRMSDHLDKKRELESAIAEDERARDSRQDVHHEPAAMKRSSSGVAASVILSVIGICLAAAGFAIGQPILYAGVLLVPVGAALAYMSSKRGVPEEITVRRDDGLEYRIKSNKASLQNTENNIASMKKEANDISIAVGISRTSFNADISLLSELLECSKEYRRASMQVSDATFESRDARSDLNLFLSRFGGEERFLKLLADKTEKIGLLKSAEALQRGITSSGYDPNYATEGDLDVSALKSRISEADGRLGELRIQMASILNADDLEQLNDSKASLSSDIVSMSRRWGTLSVASSLIDVACQELYSSVQPGVITTADRYIRLMTGNKYGFEIDPRNNEISVRSAEGTKIEGQWSSGLEDQVKLSIKLAVARELSAERLPILLDDVLLMFDRNRKKGGCAALADISKDMQVLLFTCDRETRDLAVEAGGKLIEM